MQSLCTVRLYNYSPLPRGSVYSHRGTRALRELKVDTFTRREDEGLGCYVIDAEIVSKKNFGTVNGTPQLGSPQRYRRSIILPWCQRKDSWCLHVLAGPMGIFSSTIIQFVDLPLFGYFARTSLRGICPWNPFPTVVSPPSCGSSVGTLPPQLDWKAEARSKYRDDFLVYRGSSAHPREYLHKNVLYSPKQSDQELSVPPLYPRSNSGFKKALPHSEPPTQRIRHPCNASLTNFSTFFFSSDSLVAD